VAPALAETFERWTGEDVSIGDIERELARLREATDGSYMRTSVMTHLAWVPEEWLGKALDTLHGLQERHPSRAIIMTPRSGEEARIDAVVSLHRFKLPGVGREVCTEVIEFVLHGSPAQAPASVVLPLLIPDLPVFLRWRGRPDFAADEWQQLLGVTDRLIVDSTEWPDLPQAYHGLEAAFDEVAASDIAWARTGRWRALLASLWPEVAGVQSIRVHGTAAQAHLLRGWLVSRLGHPIELEIDEADLLQGVELDGEPAPFPPGQAPPSSELLSDELDRYGRDPVYEQAVRAAAG
jgi:Glucose-6-phosphate dehydrogenase subunit